MERGDISFLKQLISSLEDAESKLKKAYEKKDIGEFNEVKSFMLKIQKQIADTIK
jgi:hypothetical protein